MITIKNRWNGDVIKKIDAANLRDADLRDANLCCADLRDADLRGANMRGANLLGADLHHANLRDANLRDANLLGADLRDANLCCAKNTPIVINGLRWVVQISGTGWMQIGCQKHSVSEWSSFDDERIAEMSPDALPFWQANKTVLLALCEQWIHSAEDEVQS